MKTRARDGWFGCLSARVVGTSPPHLLSPPPYPPFNVLKKKRERLLGSQGRVSISVRLDAAGFCSAWMSTTGLKGRTNLLGQSGISSKNIAAQEFKTRRSKSATSLVALRIFEDGSKVGIAIRSIAITHEASRRITIASFRYGCGSAFGSEENVVEALPNRGGVQDAQLAARFKFCVH